MQTSTTDLAALPAAAFKDYVLYVYPGDANCEAALAALARKAGMRENVHVQNIEHLASLPEWLDGVPIVEDKVRKRAFKGTACMEWLDTAAAAAAGVPGALGILGNAPVGRNQIASGKSMAFADGAVLSDGRDAAPEAWQVAVDDTDPTGKISATDVDAYLRRREAAVRVKPA